MAAYASDSSSGLASLTDEARRRIGQPSLSSDSTAMEGPEDDAMDDAMEIDKEPLATTPEEADRPSDRLTLASRAYQLEMFEESLRRNIIVAMDTGTGKTRIAILRIRAELERSPPPSTVWFLAPTVLLCNQQFKAISSQMQGTQGKVITSESNAENWKKETWDGALVNVRFVVATPRVLLEALIHGFVSMASIPLLVFDEAHGCVKANDGRRIMLEFYYPGLNLGLPRPAILGLTASPVQGKNLDGFEDLEETLNAICVTPTRYRDELLTHTNRPLTFRHLCGSEDESVVAAGSNMQRLVSVSGLRDDHERNITQLQSQYKGHLTDEGFDWTWKCIASFLRRAGTIHQLLGPWAAEYYIHKVIRRCAKAQREDVVENGEPYLMFLLACVEAAPPTWPGLEENHAAFVGGLSSRVHKLVEILLGYQGKQPTGIVFVQQRPMAAVLARIISLHPALQGRFQAGHVVGMARNTYGEGSFDKLLHLSPRDRGKALQEFRDRKLNLLVATSVIEEGIDIPACNLVICVDELTSLKGFIQRRGRARDDKSEFHLLMDTVASKEGLADEWESLEAEMKKKYEDELREAEHLLHLEAQSDVTDQLLPPLYVPSTGARMPAKDAKQHLQHFCDTMSSSAFVETRPIYRIDKSGNRGGGGEGEDNSSWMKDETGLIRAFVQLPINLPAHLRYIHSAHAWRTQGDAFIDAAFQAYKKLFEAGLITDHLLPPQQSTELLNRTVEGRPGLVIVHDPYRPWPRMLQQWKAIQASPPARGDDGVYVYRHALRIVTDDEVVLYEADLILPSALPAGIPPFKMFWTPHSGRSWTVHIGEARKQAYGLGKDQYHDSNDQADVLLHISYGHRWNCHGAHRPIRVVCTDEEYLGRELMGARPFDPRIFASTGGFMSPDMTYLVRDVEGAPYIYQGFMESKPPANLARRTFKGFDDAPEDATYLALRPWPKVVGMLHETVNVEVRNGFGDADVDDDDDDENGKDDNPPPDGSVPVKKKYPRVLLAADCRVDNLPMAYVQLGSLLPPLNQVLEVYLVAAELLSSTRLCQLPIRNISLVVTAISTPLARLPTNYEYLEFIGDSILKVCATANCAAQNLLAPEGHLSLYKDRLVANSRLCRAALELGLDRFIVARQWSLRQWRKYCDKLNKAAAAADANRNGTKAKAKAPAKPPQLEMSTKVLADVVEALIGACHEDGGMPLALQCLGLFVPDYQWLSLETCRNMLYNAAPETVSKAQLPPPELEQLVGYTFTKKSLLFEALTHASVPGEQGLLLGGGGGAMACMERLEFIGDAILDHVIVQKLTTQRQQHSAPLSHQRMHLLRTTLANAAFLGFATMAFAISEAATSVMVPKSATQRRQGPNGSGPGPDQDHVVVQEMLPKPLWAFMRHGASREMGLAQQATAQRFAALKDDILEALWAGTTYPWALLTRLHAEKFYSDILEAVIGAIWVDSGSLAAVEALLEAVGLLPYLRRAVDEDVHLLHPKEELGVITGNAKIKYTVERVTRKGRSPEELAAARRKQDQKNRHRTDGSDSEDTDYDDEDMTMGHNGAAYSLADASDATAYSCQLFINGKLVVEISDGVSRDDATTRAADFAVNAWKRGDLA